jgi:glycine/D-amino acid oxidase-like deaminating enzyme
MSMSDVGETGVLDAEIDRRETLDDATLSVAAAVWDASERLYDPGACAWRWASAARRAGSVAVVFRAGVRCRPADVTALRPYLGIAR